MFCSVFSTYLSTIYLLHFHDKFLRSIISNALLDQRQYREHCLCHAIEITLAINFFNPLRLNCFFKSDPFFLFINILQLSITQKKAYSTPKWLMSKPKDLVYFTNFQADKTGSELTYQICGLFWICVHLLELVSFRTRII